MRKLDYYGFIEQSEYESLASMGRSKNNEQDVEIGELGKKNEEQDTKIGEIEGKLNNTYTKTETENKINERVGEIINGAPEAFDTLKEIADALEDNDDAVASIFQTLSGKADSNDVYTKAEIDTLEAQKLAVSDFNTYSGTVASLLGEKALQSSVDTLNEAIEGVYTKEEVDAALEGKQDKGNYLSYTDDNGRKVIGLNNNDIIGSVANEGELADKVDVSGWVSLIHLNRWNVVDLGDQKTLTNINTPKDVRPTVQEEGQSGPNAHKIAYLDDVEVLTARIEALENEIKALKGN